MSKPQLKFWQFLVAILLSPIGALAAGFDVILKLLGVEIDYNESAPEAKEKSE